MADKNFARSGTADTDLLADDDPLSELARLVGYEPRPVSNVDRSSPEPVEVAPRRDNPVLALEDELMRAFEQYDTPRRVVPEPVAQTPAARHVEPVFEEPAPVAEDRASMLDEVPTRGDAVYAAPSRHEPSLVDDVRHSEPEPVFEDDPSLLLADELEAVVNEVASIEAEPVVHAGRQFADRFEPRFEEPVRNEPIIETVSSSGSNAEDRQPAFLGFQPMAAEENSLDDLSLHLERELELSIGDGFADDLVSDERGVAEAAFVELQPVAVETVESNAEPVFEDWTPAEPQAEPFQAETTYAKDEPQFVADLAFDSREERARAAAEVESQWQAEEPVFDATPEYRVESVETSLNDRDALLAEVERYPVPEIRAPLSGGGTSRNPANISAIFGRRATPTTQHREPVVAKVETPVVEPVLQPVAKVEPTPVFETREEPVVTQVAAPVVSEPEIDFDSMEFDLSDIDLDLSDFSLDEVPAKQETPVQQQARVAEIKPVEVKPVEAKPTVVTPVRREPAVAVPVSAYTTPQPVIAEMADGSLPFDPTMIAETDEGVSPVTELDVPQLPVIEKEKPPVYQPDYEFDIDAEMAQLFTEPAAKPARTESLQAGVAVGAVAAAVAQPVTQINDVDDFERALEEDFRRSLNQPERMAIPVDPGQATQLYGGDGYDDEQSRPRRGLLIAASIAGLLLIGGGGVYAWSTFTGGGATSGEPRVILADKDPVKVVPEEKGGKTVPNQDKAVYDRVAGDTANTPQQEQLVTSTEEPVDVVQRTLTPEALPDDSFDTPATAEDDGRLLPGVDEPETASAEGGNKPLVSPRKVKTMIVKPDGTLVAREDIVGEPATETAGLDAKATATTAAASGEASATANATIDANASLRAEQNATDGQPRSALAEVASAEVEDTAPVRTVRTTTIGATTGTSTGDNAPVPGTRPIDQPVNVVGTVTENGNLAGTQTAEAKPTETQQTAEQTQVAAVAPGSYVVQIASLPSEAEAQKSYKSLSAKFGSVIGGRGVDIKKAEIAGKGTFFRVRIPAGSREEANALCGRYKSAGGSCLVTR